MDSRFFSCILLKMNIFDMDRQEFLKRRKILAQDADLLFSKIEKNSQEEGRVINVLNNASVLLDDIEKDFEKRTSFDKTDVYVLFLSTALQLLRIYVLPKFQKKFEDGNRVTHNDPKIKKELAEKADDYVTRKKANGWTVKKGKYPTWEDIVRGNTGVGYDKTKGAKDFGIKMHGGLHRVKALGHDPILGWIYGVANILTNTITIAPEYLLGEKEHRYMSLLSVKSYQIVTERRGKRIETFWGHPISTYFSFSKESVFYNAFESLREDKKRLLAAVFAQGNHLYSDKYTPEGLPVPFLSLIDTDKAFEIYKKGYDWLDFKYDVQMTMTSASIAVMLNNIIELIHLYFYNPNKESDFKLYTVKSHKIVLYSNLLATSSDVIQTAIRSCLNDTNALKTFDLGGFLVTLYRLIKDVHFIRKVKEEFILREWENVIFNVNQIL